MANTTEIKIPNIEKELSGLRDSSEKIKQIKACLFTLIIYAHEPRRINYLQGLIDSILDKFPCRIIFIQGDSHSSQTYFRVNVSNVMSGQEGNKVACDQITVEATRDQLFRVPFLVLPHIMPDLPVYLLWSQTPFEEKDIFPSLQPYASRVIFDSECSDDLLHFCQEMEKNLDSLKMDIMDMNWALLSSWRDMLAHMFDTPEKMDHIRQCRTVRIIYNDTKTETMLHPEIRAIYLQGWLASRLNWTYRSMETYDRNSIIAYVSGLYPIIVTLSPQSQPDLQPGSIIGIDIATTNGNSYCITRQQSLSQVLVHASSLEKCDLPYSLPLPDVHRGLNFMKEIFYYKLSDHYRQTLKIIAQLDKAELKKL